MGLIDWLRRLIEALRKVPTPPPPPKPEPPAPDPEPEEPGPVVLANRPTQPLVYHRGSYPLSRYAQPGALAITIGRDEDQDPQFKAIAEAGGTVLCYLDPIIDNPYGRYHQLLHGQSEFGPATGLWPTADGRGIQANDWGRLVDFRPGSIVQQKWEKVLRRVVQECPHIGGFFIDDCGSRSWFAGVPWDSWSSVDQQAYRDGAHQLIVTARKVADEHGLIVIANGTWGAGDLRRHGGGWPDVNRHGHALLDGGMVENHSAAEVPGYWRAYCTQGQWAAQSPVTNGVPFMLATNRLRADRDAFIGLVSHAEAQQDYSEATAPPKALPFHPTGLPSSVRRS